MITVMTCTHFSVEPTNQILESTDMELHTQRIGYHETKEDCSMVGGIRLHII